MFIGICIQYFNLILKSRSNTMLSFLRPLEVKAKTRFVYNVNKYCRKGTTNFFTNRLSSWQLVNNNIDNNINNKKL
jgi:hypothetical protein